MRRNYSQPAEYAPLVQLSGSPIVPAVRRQLVKARAITLRRSIINLNARLYGGAPMKCLTVRQPWAHAIIAGAKRIENRSRPTRYRGPLLIHAARTRDDLRGRSRLPCGQAVPRGLVFGAVLGMVQLVDCVRVDDLPPDPYAEGPWCWVLSDPVALARPLPHVGQLAFFDVPDDLIEPTTIMPYPARGFDEPDMARVAIGSRRGSL
jgi:hypothetical protein